METHIVECIPVAWFFSQDGFVGLRLEATRTQLCPELFAQKHHASSLAGFAPHSYPEPMNMIRIRQ